MLCGTRCRRNLLTSNFYSDLHKHVRLTIVLYFRVFVDVLLLIQTKLDEPEKKYILSCR